MKHGFSLIRTPVFQGQTAIRDFVPSDLGASLLAYWNADRSDLITLNTNKVTSWKDTVNAYDAVQGTDAARPTYANKSLTFDGTDDYGGIGNPDRRNGRCHVSANFQAGLSRLMLPESLAVLAAVAGLLGLCVGSFLNVVIHRLPKMMEQDWQAQCSELRGEMASTAGEQLSLAKPRSRCPNCGHQITALENIPIISYLMILRGKCSGCGSKISPRYPIIEAMAGLLSAYAAWHFGPTVQTIAALALLWALIALSAIDLDTQLLPDSITLPLLWLGLGFNLWATYTDLSSSVIGAMLGYLALWSVFWLFKIATGKEGMGYGDFKLLAALGAWLGWQMLPAIILLSSVVGAIVGITLIIATRHGRNVPIPFGPYLAAAGVIALFWGTQITRGYLNLIG